MGVIGRAIQLASLVATGLHLYNYYQEVQDEKITIYNALPANLQTEWVATFGDPNPAPVQNLTLPLIAPKPGTLAVAAPIVQLKAGT